VRLTAGQQEGGGIEFSWTRRTRIDGDRWDGLDVPLGEATEQYLVRVIAGGSVRREEQTSVPFWTYSSVARATDGVTGAFDVEVAQISDRFGPGLKARIGIDG
jgi:hypothetical protein